MKSTTFTPRILDAFSREVSPLLAVAAPTDEQVLTACEVITRYTGLLQAADLSLSQREAGAMLKARIQADRLARRDEIAAQVNALIESPISE